MVEQHDRDHPGVRPRRAASPVAGARHGQCSGARFAGAGYLLINNDAAIEELPRKPDDSVDLIVTSIPFSTQYEYSPNYADFGHTDDNDHFWRQMDFLTPSCCGSSSPAGSPRSTSRTGSCRAA